MSEKEINGNIQLHELDLIIKNIAAKAIETAIYDPETVNDIEHFCYFNIGYTIQNEWQD